MCLPGGLGEDNARFILHFAALTLYMLAGAAIFQQLEADLEVQQTAEFWRVYHSFRKYHLQGSPIALQRLDELLYAYGNASFSGVINKSRRWDFLGSFHFVGTIVSTIGYGNTTPQTRAGKVVAVLYGFLGCSGGILFFNLFLERIITFLAWILRVIHIHRLKRHIRKNSSISRRSFGSSKNEKSLPDILEDDDDHLDVDEWKPSVYWVMLFLLLVCCMIACCAAAVYVQFEHWEYFDALYFCFVSFATIGFGDFVSTQNSYYPYIHWYRFINFIFLLIGCCCTYSLLNVTSIIIKQGLNCIIQKIQCRNQEMAASHLPKRKYSLSTIYFSKRRGTRIAARDSFKSDYLETPRRMSGELISMQDFFSANKVSLAVMQKELYEMAQSQKGASVGTIASNAVVLKSDAVGPLAIVTEKFKNKMSRKK
ncbi:potassium channel subfamily K member 13-like isoform X1 [Bombus vancouverensis nearcticus]|uniref:Potassium channel subfamily K member 13-like n=1 Tax=Bombus bifarius TaxID=103933 RepID=A0A6P8NEK1_9HYME|nr:potassium channel subfamily K member 13-like [Bombus vancouverensis nearcticus]XP_033313032.1 potassium channel subfamily K member 13-like [Bombus bifarius]XP_050478193.1 potassium channel subfamily K member 13-like [Bombus huntii]